MQQARNTTDGVTRRGQFRLDLFHIAPASVTLTASAADSDGSIAAVEFYNGGTLIASLTTPPYTYTWSDATTGDRPRFT